MPLEIRELIIKAGVGTGDGANAGAVSSAGEGANSTNAEEQLVQQCVEKVLEILKEKLER